MSPYGITSRAHARHFENGVLDAYGMHCKHNYQRYHSYFCVHQQKHAYFADGRALSRALTRLQWINKTQWLSTTEVQPGYPVSNINTSTYVLVGKEVLKQAKITIQTASQTVQSWGCVLKQTWSAQLNNLNLDIIFFPISDGYNTTWLKD